MRKNTVLLILVLVMLLGVSFITFSNSPAPEAKPIPQTDTPSPQIPTSPEPTTRPTLNPTAKYISKNAEPTPDFVRSYGPFPQITYSEYMLQKNDTSKDMLYGIHITIKLYDMKFTSNDCVTDKWTPRATLFVDGVEISNDSYQLAIAGLGDSPCNSSIFYYSWAPDLSPGVHKATFIFKDDSENKLEYSWVFLLEP